jgi:hypothetical protein
MKVALKLTYDIEINNTHQNIFIFGLKLIYVCIYIKK